MKLSHYYLPTLREEPAEAVTRAHGLMARSAMARMTGVGVYSLLPYGVEMMEKLQEEILRALFEGGLKVSTSRLQPRALWEASGRWDSYGSNMYKVADRYYRQAALAPESEEAFLNLVKGELKSYKQLPLFLYEAEKEFNNIEKPKAGFGDAREANVIDGYQFNTSIEESEGFYLEKIEKAKSFLDEWKISYKTVETDDAFIFYGTGEGYPVDLAWCGEKSFYKDLAPIAYALPKAEEPLEREDIHTPDAATIKDLSDMIGVEPARCAKAVDLNINGDAVFVFVPGDRELNLKKLAAYLKVDEEAMDMLDEETISEMGSFPGFTGPIGLSQKARIIVDRSVTKIDNMVVGANRVDYHRKNVNYGRDFEAEIAGDILSVEEGDETPEGEEYTFGTGFELLRVKKPSDGFAKSMKVQFLNESGKEAPFVTTGVSARVTSIMAAVLEAHHDDKGLNFPVGLSPYDVAITIANAKKEDQLEGGLELYRALKEKGISVLLDDRNERAGVKFNDRDLLGIPLQVTAGKDIGEGLYECKRRGGEAEKLPLTGVVDFIADVLS